MPDDDDEPLPDDRPLPPEALRFLYLLGKYVRHKDENDPGWRERRREKDHWRKRPRKRVLKPKEPKSRNGS